MSAPTAPPRAPASGEPAADTPTRARPRASWLRRTTGRPRPPAAGPTLLGVAAAAWAIAIGLVLVAVPMLVAWIAAPAAGLNWQEALRIAGTIWSVAQTAPVTIGTVTYSLTPWGLAIVAVLLVSHGGRWALRRCASGRPTLVVLVTAAVTYAVAAGLVALVSGNATADVAPASAAARGFGIALLGLAIAALRERRLADLVLPAWLTAAARGGLAAAGVLVAVAAALAAIVLAARLDDMATILGDLDAGLGGGLVVLLLGLGYVPVLVTWALSYVLGAGVVLGPAVTASPFIAVTPPTLLPPFPLLAAVPATAGPLAWALPATGVVAGVVAGIVVGRSARREARLVRVAIALLAATITGLAVATMAALSSGGLGDLRLAHLGPSPLAVGVLAMLAVALGAMPTAAIPAPPERPGLRVAAADTAATAAAPESTVDASGAGSASLAPDAGVEPPVTEPLA